MLIKPGLGDNDNNVNQRSETGHEAHIFSF
jgi:hypothetical protein